MAIQNNSQSQMAALQRVLSQVDKATVFNGEAGQTISESEAQSIIKAVQDLPPASQVEAKNAIQSLVADRFIALTDSSRLAFAKAFQLPATRAVLERKASHNQHRE